MLTVKNGKTKDWANMSLFDLAEGGAEDCYYTFKIYELLEKEIEKVGLTKLYKTLISPLTTKFAKIEREGLKVDETILPKIGEKLKEKIDKLKEEIKGIPEVKDYNLGSSQQKCKILFTDEDGFGLYPTRKSKKTGEPSSDAQCLDELLSQIEEELELRKKK